MSEMTRHYKDIIGNIYNVIHICRLRICCYWAKSLYLWAFLCPYWFFFLVGAAGRRQFRRRLRLPFSTFRQRLLISFPNKYPNNILIEACKSLSVKRFGALVSHFAHGAKSSQTRCQVISDTVPSHLRHFANGGLHNCGNSAGSFRTLFS